MGSSVKFKTGDRVRKKDGTAFSNDQLVATLAEPKSDYSFYLEETDRWMPLRALILAESTAPTEEEDTVVKPSHYTRWAIEPINFIQRNGFEFWRGNIVKYVCRAGFKMYPNQDATQSEITDLKKVIRYSEMRINQLNGETVL